MEKDCSFACSKVVKLIENKSVPANTGISLPPYTNIDGYRFINIFVKFDQEKSTELPVDLGVVFAFDERGEMGARRYVNLESNVPASQNTNFIDVSGAGSWHGSPHNISTYLARFPVMGPFVEVFVYNRDAKARKVSVWAYLVS
ncbi:MAG: hypothetical protein H7246_20730 [Phycisphaerae bacterium]|nr:hypothetical protein [Saprospiraceae bacterium]